MDKISPPVSFTLSYKPIDSLLDDLYQLSFVLNKRDT